MKQHIELLGKKAKDRVTGFKGVISSVSFDLYGCIQAAITPPVDKNGETTGGQWFDVTRLEVNTGNPVMAVPDFDAGYVADGLKGAAEKPAI
jgi:hypothetical protein